MHVQLPLRTRRLRHNHILREMTAQHHLTRHDLVMPLFIRHGTNEERPIKSMPGHAQYSIDRLAPKISALVQAGIPAVMLFGIPAYKDPTGSEALDKNGLIPTAIRAIKDLVPDLLVMTDLCMCEYTDTGHCGVMCERNGCIDLDNDATLPLLQQQALNHVEAGADILAPSGMIDGVVQALRTSLDHHGLAHIPLMPHTIKFASNLYGPFREAAEGAPQFGDRKTYQADYRTGGHALREASLDLAEGADILLVKPALFYLDIIQKLHTAHPAVPIAGYMVSGEFTMLKRAVMDGLLSTDAILEAHIAIKRAGADIIITYFAEELACLL